ncbi:efflux RND transporter periplasmic adaptor subunit [Pontiellaceae bacterium B12227]|nr:efflux RND transporter periplasmic adaptor subunit [Pontiellaceae bacterium B12227]
MKKPLQRRSVQIGIGLAVIVVAALILKPGEDDSRVDMETAHLCQVERGDLVVSILQSGELMAKSSREVLNEAYRDAKIISIVEDGTTVTNGQLLFELESTQLEERLLDQQSDVAEAEASLKLAQENLLISKLKNATDLDGARLKVELAVLDLEKYEEVEYTQMVDKATSDIYLAEQQLQTARIELEGTQELYDKGYSNQTELKADQFGVESKEIEVRNKKKDLYILQQYTHRKRSKELNNALKNARSALERLEKTIMADVESKAASIASKKTRLEIERNQLITREEQFENTKAYADFAGQVFYPKQRRYGSLGKIEEGSTVQFRQPILSFPDLSAWDMKVGIPEAMIDKVSMGQEAVATLDAVPGMMLKGQVRKISAVPDSQNWYSSGVKTYTIMVDVLSDANGQLKPGMSATVEIVTDELYDVLYIPIQAVVSNDEKHYVYIVKRGRKELREVEIGKFNTQYIEVVSGLEEGEEMLLYAEVELESETNLKKSPLTEESKEKDAKADDE